MMVWMVGLCLQHRDHAGGTEALLGQPLNQTLVSFEALFNQAGTSELN
jgi:hypothetical protein